MSKVETILNFVNDHINSLTNGGAGYYVKSIDSITPKGAEVTFGHPAMRHDKDSLKYTYTWMGSDQKEVGLVTEGWTKED